MSEEYQEAENVDVAIPQDETTQVIEAESQEYQEPSTVQKPSTEDQDRNWRLLREKAEIAERRASDLERQNAEYIGMVKDFISPKKQETEPDEDDSDFATIGHTKKTARREAETISEKMIRKVLDEEKQNRAPQELKNRFADFDEVVTVENVNYLKKNEPELAKSFIDNNDLYSKGVSAYKMIKSLGIHKKDSAEAMKQDSSKNTAKPVSPNAILGRNSVGDANIYARGITPDLKKQYQKEMSDAIKRR